MKKRNVGHKHIAWFKVKPNPEQVLYSVTNHYIVVSISDFLSGQRVKLDQIDVGWYGACALIPIKIKGTVFCDHVKMMPCLSKA